MIWVLSLLVLPDQIEVEFSMFLIRGNGVDRVEKPSSVSVRIVVVDAVHRGSEKQLVPHIFLIKIVFSRNEDSGLEAQSISTVLKMLSHYENVNVTESPYLERILLTSTVGSISADDDRSSS